MAKNSWQQKKNIVCEEGSAYKLRFIMTTNFYFILESLCEIYLRTMNDDFIYEEKQLVVIV